MTDLIYIILLSLPTLYAVYEDRNGDKHPNHDWTYILVIMVICSTVVALTDDRTTYWLSFVRAFLMSFSIYVLLFNWLINYVLWKRGVVELRKGVKWYNHFNKTSWPDRWMVWNTARWWQRVFIQLLVCSPFWSVYFCPCKIVSYYNECFICRWTTYYSALATTESLP